MVVGRNSRWTCLQNLSAKKKITQCELNSVKHMYLFVTCIEKKVERIRVSESVELLVDVSGSACQQAGGGPTRQ